MEQIASESKGAEDRRLASVSVYPELTIRQALKPLKASRWMCRIEICRFEQPLTWRLLNVQEDGTEELVFTVHGVVCNLDLPPILERLR